MSVLDKARKRIASINEKKSEFGSADFWKAHPIKTETDPGDAIRMICPPYLDKPDAEPWVESQVITFQVGKDKQYFTHAPSKFGLDDVVAEYRKELYQRGDEKSKKKAQSLRAKDTYFALIIDLNEPEKGVQIWSFGNMIMEVLCNKLLNDEYNIFWNFDDGHDIIVKKYVGDTNLDTKYVVDLSPKPRSVIDSIKRLMNEDEAEKFSLTKDDILEQASKIDLANFVKVDTEETLVELLKGELPDDYEKVFKNRRDERDAVNGRPLPLFIARENATTKEEVENRRRVAEEDEEIMNDPLFGPAPGEKKEEASAARKASKTSESDEPIGKTFSFEDQETDDEGDPIGEPTLIEGVCTAAKVDDDLGLCYILDCGAHGKYEVPVNECTEVVKAKKRFSKPAKSEKQSSVLDQMQKIKEEADDEI